ncbi:MAG: AAA family ATPase, partial [Rubrobacteraceae bacterium]|nr:AAA family ATPase [Rubrobacteraceae bacterium]
MRVWLLGGFRVSIGARTIEDKEWRLRKAAALLKVLSLAQGRRLHREQVMELLWPEVGEQSASNNLRNVLHAARRALGPTASTPYLASEGEALVLCPRRPVWVDVDAFEEAAASARRSSHPAAYRGAIDLYTGDLLPNDRYEGWAEGRREELQRLYLALLVELAELYGERDEHTRAVEALRTATAKEPALEEAHAALMRLHALLDRPEQALAQYERLRDALLRRLGTEPAETTRRLRDEIAKGTYLTTEFTGSNARGEKVERAGPTKHNLPAPRTSFVGRVQGMVDVKRTLAMTRLLTLTGTGGSGKTRLALEVAGDLIDAYPDGVWMVDLAPLSEPQLVDQEVAGALEVPERPGEPLTNTLSRALLDKHLLLILDNCEHLVETTAQLVDAILDSCPRLRVLATSREPLGIHGEVLWQVQPLSVPATTDLESSGGSAVEDLIRYEAVKLFVDRTRLKVPHFAFTQENVDSVAKVCRKLDGIPLAIELATARMGTLAIEQVSQRLEASLDVLKSASRSAAPRHQTLRATLDWSHDLLPEAEQALFRRLSVFAGGWTLETAESVCTGGGIERESILDLIGGLVDKSHVVAGSVNGGVVRYRMLEPVRQYAREKLEGSGEVDDVRSRHAAFFLTLAEEAEPELKGARQEAWLERLEREHDNLRAALSWTLERDEVEIPLRFGAALGEFWHMRGHLNEGRRWLEATLAKGDA